MSLRSSPVPEEDAVRAEPGERKRFNPGPKKPRSQAPRAKKIQYEDSQAARENLEELSKTRPLKPPGKYPYTIGRHRSG